MRRALGALLPLVGALRLSPHCLRPPATASIGTRICAVAAADMDQQQQWAASPCGQWELDFYSRPVQGPDGKKLWELLVTDSSGSFQHVEAVPSNCVNSRELRTRVQRLIDAAEVKPSSVRFFRVQMKNMISIALNELPGVECKPSRVTYRLNEWLEQRDRDIYPTMPGYRKPRPESQPIKLPVRATPHRLLRPIRFQPTSSRSALHVPRCTAASCPSLHTLFSACSLPPRRPTPSLPPAVGPFRPVSFPPSPQSLYRNRLR